MRNKNVNNDAAFLKSKHVTSPDLSKMEFRYFNARMKMTVFFTSQEGKDRYIERLENPALVESGIKKGGRMSKEEKVEIPEIEL